MKNKNIKIDNKKLYSIGYVATLLGVHIQTLRRMDEAGTLKAVRFGPKGMRRYRKADIDKYVNG